MDNKMDKFEQNQQKVFDYLKYSVEQDKLKNEMDINNINYRQKNNADREYLLNMLKEVPFMVHNRMNQIYQEEMEENRKQNQFLNNLINQVISELKDQRRQDNIK